jgi:hypothetical protein
MNKPSVIASINGRRVRHGVRVDWPLDLYWFPSKACVGGRLTISVRGYVPTIYTVIESRSSSGRQWSLFKSRNEWHTVTRESLRYSCDCRGFTSCGHCRHSDAIAWLDSAGYFEIVRGLYVDA